MKTAVIIDQLPDEMVTKIEVPDIADNPDSGAVFPMKETCPDEAAALLDPFISRVQHYKASLDWYYTFWVGPHIDNIVGDVTIGVVLRGNHYLFMGAIGKKVGDLRPGTVYLLNNKRLHGAYRVDQGVNLPLVFVAVDLVASYKEAYRALKKHK